MIERLGSWLISVHFTQVALDGALRSEARDRVTGASLREHYELDELPEPLGIEGLRRPRKL